MRVIDSHTGGQPTRVIVEGGPDLGRGPLVGRLARFRSDHDRYRTMSVLEPKCADAMVGSPPAPGADSRNFVLCPGGAYDRSPCGTGTSAKLACLAASGRLAPGETRVQESIIGSRFEARYRPGSGGGIIPSIAGTAHVFADTRLVVQDADPFRWGIV